MIIIFIVIDQLIYLILITYFQQEHHVEVSAPAIRFFKLTH